MNVLFYSIINTFSCWEIYCIAKILICDFCRDKAFNNYVFYRQKYIFLIKLIYQNHCNYSKNDIFICTGNCSITTITWVSSIYAWVCMSVSVCACLSKNTQATMPLNTDNYGNALTTCDTFLLLLKYVRSVVQIIRLLACHLLIFFSNDEWCITIRWYF